MKKHLFGFALFSFIFASFAVAFAFFYAPRISEIALVEEVRQPVFESDRRNRCNKKTEVKKFEVYSTEFDWDRKKLISKVVANLGNYTKDLFKFHVETELYTENQSEVNKIKIKEVVVNKFEVVNKLTGDVVFYVESDISNLGQLNRKENLYAIFNFRAYHLEGEILKVISEKSEPESVLFVHGKSSINKK